ncbi:hypothetical protein PV327_006391 [Microctonus hyperodae]|uniref:Complement component 1 Q subcomponent-binding protein, mitochondrial n=1 Tax=Microctonus hyperodae TaxID=165561 RepID=A0AA39KIC4_MICHY|nr:hypothetical protein PV327_006391 [Microctonus hyperodae]
MSGIMRNILRIPKFNNLVSSTSTNMINVRSSRSIWHMSEQNINKSMINSSIKMLKPVDVCGYNCRCSRHTRAEKDLVTFLADEIQAEKKAQKLKTIPTEVDGFTVSLDGAHVTLSKKENDEKITIAFNVNHTVNTETDAEVDPSDDKPEFGEMQSKPNFTIDIVHGQQTLGFSCSFTDDDGASNGNETYNDCFCIDEVTIYEGELNDKVYAVAGDVLDGYLYDLLMNYLEEKGISNEFVEKIAELSTSYEHSAYISLLEGISKFTNRS